MTSRTVLVTGASSGIGRATAIQAAAAGDHVALLARRKEKLEEVAEECAAAGASGTTIVAADVADAILYALTAPVTVNVDELRLSRS